MPLRHREQIHGIEIRWHSDMEGARVLSFLESVTNNNGWDFSRLGKIKFYDSSSKRDWWTGSITYGKRDIPAKIICGVPDWWTYPRTMKVPIGTTAQYSLVLGSDSSVQNEWMYTYEDMLITSREDAFIKVLGHELFHFLKKTKQLNTQEWGRNGNPAANRFAIWFLKLFNNYITHLS